MRLIDADRAKDAIYTDFWEHFTQHHDSDQTALIDMLMDDIDETPTITPSGWVSVEERLPEPGERVLATDCGFVGEFYINKRGQWQRYNVNCSELLMALDILYWMPLPAPPDLRPPEGEA